MLLVGEPGVGKEDTAERIHRRSTRVAYPLVRVDCTLGEDNLERGIFGEDAGLRPAKAGALERAQGGSMFLDQVGEMALGVQVKLARALEIKRFSRMNGSEARTFDVRVTAASHVAIEPLITSGRLRRELYNRVNGIAIAIPALRERKSDLPLLAASFCDAPAGSSASASRCWARTPSPRSTGTPGPATSASCARSSSARRSSATATQSSPST